MKRRTKTPDDGDAVEQVAGNGLLHRRALLGRSVAVAGVLGAGVGPGITGAAAEPLVEPPWGLKIGDNSPAYQTPSKFAKMWCALSPIRISSRAPPSPARRITCWKALLSLTGCISPSSIPASPTLIRDVTGC